VYFAGYGLRVIESQKAAIELRDIADRFSGSVGKDSGVFVGLEIE
jgi:hypothetical protein